MVWPLEYEERVNTKAFHAQLARSNPDTRKWNKADISGRGPDGKVFTSWGREFSLFSSPDTPANYREKIFNIPSNFTSQLLEDFALAFARNDKELLRYVRDYVELPKIYLSEYYDVSLKKMVENKTSVHEKRDHEVLVINKPHEFADPIKESSYEMCPTTGPVASAINRIRNITSPEIISVEKGAEVSVLEEIEKKLCFSMHQYCLENGIYD